MRRTLKPDDVVMILDRVTPSGTPQVGVVSKVYSDRTYGLTYVQKEAKMDRNTFKITKPATKGTLKRPINQLAMVCSKDECQNVNMEFVDVDKTLTQGKIRPAGLEDEFLGEDETFNDENVDQDHVDDHLDEMIVDGQPAEVVDEIERESVEKEEEPDIDMSQGTNENEGEDVAAGAVDNLSSVVVAEDKAAVEPETVQEHELEEPVVEDTVQGTELQEAQGNHEDIPLGTPVDASQENTLNKVHKKKENKLTIIDVDDKNIEEMTDLATSEDVQPSTKTKGRPKGKKRRKRFFY